MNTLDINLTNGNHCISCLGMKGVCRVIGIRFKAEQLPSPARPFEAFGAGVCFDIQRAGHRNKVAQSMIDRLAFVYLDAA